MTCGYLKLYAHDREKRRSSMLMLMLMIVVSHVEGKTHHQSPTLCYECS
jgi:hypothetical protein